MASVAAGVYLATSMGSFFARVLLYQMFTSHPSAIDHWASIASILAGKTPVVFLDYDGTLTPIVSRPELAVLSERMRSALIRLADRWPTTIVSGRDRNDLQEKVAVPGLGYAGSHGFDIVGPPPTYHRLEIGSEHAPTLRDAAAQLSAMTADIPGVLVEAKGFSVAMHYRLVDVDRLPQALQAFDDALRSNPQLHSTTGKKVLELRPRISWDKGRAVSWLLDRLSPSPAKAVALYIGDDVTDEDALVAVRESGIGILVAEKPRPSAARFILRNVSEVEAFLVRLIRSGG